MCTVVLFDRSADRVKQAMKFWFIVNPSGHFFYGKAGGGQSFSSEHFFHNVHSCRDWQVRWLCQPKKTIIWMFYLCCLWVSIPLSINIHFFNFTHVLKHGRRMFGLDKFPPVVRGSPKSKWFEGPRRHGYDKAYKRNWVRSICRGCKWWRFSSNVGWFFLSKKRENMRFIP